MNTDPATIPIDTRSLPLKKLGSFHHPVSGVHLEVHSTEPAFQFYTGKYIDVPAVGGLPARGPRSGFCWNLLGTLTLSIMSSREAWSFSNVVKNTGREMFIEHGEDKDS